MSLRASTTASDSVCRTMPSSELGGARRQEVGPAFDLHDAEPARRGRGERLVVAQGGDVDAEVARGVEDGGAGRHRDLVAVDGGLDGRRLCACRTGHAASVRFSTGNCSRAHAEGGSSVQRLARARESRVREAVAGGARTRRASLRRGGSRARRQARRAARSARPRMPRSMPSSMTKWAGSSMKARANAAGTVTRQLARQRMMSRDDVSVSGSTTNAQVAAISPLKKSPGACGASPGRAGADDERPRPVQHDDRELHRLLGIQAHVVASRLEVLPLRVDAVGAVDVEAEEVLQRVVGVEAAAVLAELDEPREDGLGGSLHGDRHASSRRAARG